MTDIRKLTESWLLSFASAGDTDLSCRHCGAIPEDVEDGARAVFHRADCPTLGKEWLE
jgi:hypothetical protein